MRTFLGEDFFGGWGACQLKIFSAPLQKPEAPPSAPLLEKNPSYATAYTYGSTDGVIAIGRSSSEVIVVDIDAGVDNVDVHAASIADGTVDVVERETDLVDAVETPGSHGARVDHSVFFNILDGVRGTKLDDGTGIENDLRGVHGIQQHYDCLIYCVQYFISTTVSLSC